MACPHFEYMEGHQQHAWDHQSFRQLTEYGYLAAYRQNVHHPQANLSHAY